MSADIGVMLTSIGRMSVDIGVMLVTIGEVRRKKNTEPSEIVVLQVVMMKMAVKLLLLGCLSLCFGSAWMKNLVCETRTGMIHKIFFTPFRKKVFRLKT